MALGARKAAFRNPKSISECLADEIINAAKGSTNSYALKKKDEVEKNAKANRWSIHLHISNIHILYYYKLYNLIRGGDNIILI